MRTSIRSRLSAAGVIALGAGLLVPALGARAAAPTYFPAGFGLTSTAFTMRFAGADRFATAGAGALVASVNTSTKSGWPYNSPIASDPTKAYGAAACPKTVFIVASDGLPDALAAASLRGIGSLTLPNNTHTFDTTNALLLLTDTARPPLNATGLNATTKTTLTAIKNSCSGGFDAIILGGTAAVPSGAESDLGAYANSVGRIAGFDRYDTAGQIASLVSSRLGLGTLNYYSTATDTGTAERGTVFLADGITGADALASGPIVADSHTPILLANAAGLPTATANALSTLKPSNIIVLGGTSALPDSVVTAAKSAAGMTNVPLRISGATRYATSVALAQHLDDIWNEVADNEHVDVGKFNNQLFGFARSEGTGADHVGWPDALSSALVIESMYRSATAPARAAPPIETNAGFVLGGVASPLRPPLLLVTQSAVPPEVHSLLTALYPDPAGTTGAPDLENKGNGYPYDGGFGFVFGGPSAVAPAVELGLAQDLSGGMYTAGANRSDLSPTFDATKVFYTAADFSKYTDGGAGTGGIAKGSAVLAGDKVCTARAADAGVQFLDLVNANGGITGVPPRVPYESANNSYPAAQSEPFCVDASTANQATNVLGVSLSGGLTNVVPLTWSSGASTLRTTVAGAKSTPNGTPAPSPSPSPTSSIDQPNQNPKGPTTLALTYTVPITMTFQGATYTSGTLNVTITRSTAPAVSPPNQPANSPSNPDTISCVGTFSALTGTGSAASPVFTANFTAESATQPSGPPGSPTQGPIMCVGEYTIGASAGGIHFAITGDDTPTGAAAGLSDLVLDGLG